MDEHIEASREGWQAVYCNWHPSVETGLSCGKCGKGTCTRCIIHASVGIRCPECGKAIKLPTFEVRPIAYAKAALIGLAVVICGGALWGVVNLILVHLGLVIFASAALPGLVVGYAAGELVSAALLMQKEAKASLILPEGALLGRLYSRRYYIQGV